MKVLFVNACCRGDASRTLRLASAFLDELTRLMPDCEVQTHELYTMSLLPMNADLLAVREPLCNARDWTHPLTAPACSFQQADLVVIAAPYWDLSFPAALKIWVENMWVRNLTFVYRNDLPVGLCRGRACVYITTAGSRIGKADFGTDYIRIVMQTLGIPGFARLSAEGLDMAEADVEALMEQAVQQVRTEAESIHGLLMADRMAE